MPRLSTYCKNTNCCKDTSHSMEIKTCRSCESTIDGSNCKLCDGCAFELKRCGHCGSRWVFENNIPALAELITEDPDVEIEPQYNKHAKTAPKDVERGWANDKEFAGERKKVEIKYQPGETEYIYHTHPTHDEPPSLIRALPSKQDLETAAKSLENGVKGFVIYNGNYYCIIRPKSKSLGNVSHYEQLVRSNDVEGALRALTNMGFEIETGEI